MLNRLVSVAPMMDCTDRHDRYFLRLIAPHVLLYSEMITTGAIIHGECEKLLKFDPLEHPVALQLGGSDPKALALSAKRGAEFGYDEINLNIGCPSDRVKSGRFGACLMREPELVADCVSAMCEAVTVPVTVKCRIGIDEEDSYAALTQFISLIENAGCNIFIIHARKAWLNGLSPKQNREIPPLRYDIVRQIKKDFPHLTIVINGGIKTVAEIKEHLQFVDGVMIGREAYSHPYFLADIEKQIFSASRDPLSRKNIITQLIPYIEKMLRENIKLSSMTRHILGLFSGEAGARSWRRYLSEHAHQKSADTEIIKQALTFIEEQ